MAGAADRTARGVVWLGGTRRPRSGCLADPLSFPADGSFIDTTTCPFPILVEVAGTYLFTEHDFMNGDYMLNRRADLTYTSTNLDTGTTLLESYWRRQLIRGNVEPPVVADDGSITYHDLYIGSFANDRSDAFHFVYAGQLDVYVTVAPDGSVTADVGVAKAGHWPSNEDAIAAYCDALT